MGKVIAICKSEKRGTPKTNTMHGHFAPEWGLLGDAHGGDWHRQVSLISAEKINEFNQHGADVKHGDFGENLVVEGIDFKALPVGTRLCCGAVVLEITQLGKQCHSHCQIYKKMGDCIMPREGVFARVLAEGEIKVGDRMTVQKLADKPFTAAVVTVSDKGARGEREDKSGPLISALLAAKGYNVVEQTIVPDEQAVIENELINLSDRRQVNLVITTGGTGFSPRDVTPEATLAVAERLAPGIAQAIQMHSIKITPRAMLTRGVSVIRKETIIINLPGSPKACEESMDAFIDTIPHALELLCRGGGECARSN